MRARMRSRNGALSYHAHHRRLASPTLRVYHLTADNGLASHGRAAHRFVLTLEVPAARIPLATSHYRLVAIPVAFSLPGRIDSVVQIRACRRVPLSVRKVRRFTP